MHSTRLKPVHSKGARQHVATFLCFDENENSILSRQVFTKVAKQVAVLVLVTADFHHLCYIFVSCQVKRPDRHLVIFMKVIACEILDFARPCCRPHEHLSIGADLSSLVYLERLDVSANEIDRFAVGAKANALEILQAYSNKFASLTSLPSFPEVRFLGFGFNELTQLPLDLSRRCPKLAALDLARRGAATRVLRWPFKSREC